MADKNRKDPAAPLNIYLTGFMCAGKTSAGKTLARLMNRRFADSDRIVEKKAGCKIAELAARRGMKIFRKFEAAALRELAGKSGFAAALGGGIYPSRWRAKLLKSTGVTVYLRCSWPELAARLAKNRAGRPLLAGEGVKKALVKAKKVFKRRQPFYERADFTVDVSALPPRQAALRVRAALSRNNK
jgi:shikimate kinase